MSITSSFSSSSSSSSSSCSSCSSNSNSNSSSSCSSCSSNRNSNSSNTNNTNKKSSSLSSTVVLEQPTYNTDVPQTLVRPFGYPEYNYRPTDNQSKSKSKLPYEDDRKEHRLARQQQHSKDNSLLWKCTSKRTYLSENDEDIIVSEVENKLDKNVRLNLKERNVHLLEEDNITQVVSIQQIVKSKKMMDTLWKLYRFPGESLQDIKKRLLQPLSEKTIEIDGKYCEQELCFNKKIANSRNINNSLDIDSESKKSEDEEKDEWNSLDFKYESPCLLADFLDIEINVNEKDNVFVQPDNLLENDSVAESINWAFHKLSETLPNPLYNVPLVKQIPCEYLTRDGKKTKRETQIVPRQTKMKSITQVQRKPIICEMYGTRTINYNCPLELQVPKRQCCSNSTNTSEYYDTEIKNREIEEKSISRANKIAPYNTNVMPRAKIKQENLLEPKNNFLNEQSRKRTKAIRFYYELSLSDFSEGDDSVSLNVNEKKGPSTLERKKNNYPEVENSAIVASIKRNDKAIPSLLELEESKDKVSMTSTESVIDLNTVKVKKSSTDVDEGSRNVCEKSKANDEDHRFLDLDTDSDSDSTSSSNSSCSSCTCSRSSCLAVSSSSSSDSSIENDHNSNITKS